MFLKLVNNAYIQVNYDINYLIFSINSQKGVLELNDSGAEILSLCDGSNTLESIISSLTDKYNEDYKNIKDLVTNFLQGFIDNKLVIHRGEHSKRKIIFGSASHYCPSSITLELTNQCPLDCKHCYLGKKENIYIEFNDIKRILDEIVGLGTFSIQLTGGEVLTYPYFEEVINYLIEKHIQINISTSGMIINDKLFSSIKKISAVGGSVRVSIDGLESTHNKIRNNSKSFSNAIYFIERLISLGVECQVTTCIIDQEKKEIEELCEFIRDRGVSKHILELVTIQGNAKDNFNMNYSYSNFNDFLKNLNEKYSSNSFIVEQPKNCNSDINCGAGYKLIKICADMSVTPCAMMEEKMGNLKDDTLSNILHRKSKLFSEVMSPNDSLCKQCTLKEKCNKCMVKSLSNKNLIENCFWFESQNVFSER